MLKEEFVSLYERNHIDSVKTKEALQYLTSLEMYLQNNTSYHQLENINKETMDACIQHQAYNDDFTVEHMIILMRYMKIAKRDDLFIRLTQYTGSLGVIESMLEKIERIIDQERVSQLKAQIKPPIFGTLPEKMPAYTKQVMDVLNKVLSEKEVKQVLADNHHHIPKETFLEERVHYDVASTLDDYLMDLHARKIEELKRCQKEHKVWFEQEINDEVIRFVSANQEILAAVRKDDYLYITKIPYDTKAFLNAKSKKDKAYHVCHCPFIKANFLDSIYKIPPMWCLCSGGFTKYPFEVLFDQTLDVELIETPLQGDLLCRFKISLKNVDYKR